MYIDVWELKLLMKLAVLKTGIDCSYADSIVEQYWEAELRGKLSHGIAKLCKEIVYFRKYSHMPEIMLNRDGLALVNGNKSIGQITARYCCDTAIKKAKEHGVSIVGLGNTQRYGMLSTWAEYIARKGMIGWVVNSSEPCVVPVGGKVPVLGSNPMAMAFPILNGVYCIDFSTAKSPMSMLYERKIRKKKLPPDTFLQIDGTYTINPEEAIAVEVFGSYKGLCLSLIIEILSSVLIKQPLGSEKKGSFQVGYYFQAIDIKRFQSLSNFKKRMSELLAYVSKTNSFFRLPGAQSYQLMKNRLDKGYMHVDKNIMRQLMKLVH